MLKLSFLYIINVRWEIAGILLLLDVVGSVG